MHVEWHQCVCVHMCVWWAVLMECAFNSMVGSKGLEEAAGKVCLR